MEGLLWFILIGPLVLVVLGLLIWSLIWVYGDAEKRGKQGWLAVLVALFVSWPFSLLLWILFRPEVKAIEEK